MASYEADDLIATYARQAREEGDEVVVVSADKDLMQLIRDGVEFYDSMKDKFFTPDDVKEKFGVYPDKWLTCRLWPAILPIMFRGLPESA